MPKTRSSIYFAVALHLAAYALLVTSSAVAAPPDGDWPHFLGPLHNGSSPERGLLREWPADGPRVLWRAKIKQGWGCPSVVGDDIYLAWTEERRGTAETLACLSAVDGSLRWQHTYEVGPYWERNIGWGPGGVRATPAVSGERVFSLGSIGHLLCLHRRTGDVLWQKNLWDEWNPSGEKGYVFSPLVEEGKLLLWYSDGASSVQTPDTFEVVCQALDPASGEVQWTFREPHAKGRRAEGQTPAVATLAGERCLIVTANCELKAIRIADGRQVWNRECVNREMHSTVIPTPLILDDRIVHSPEGEVISIAFNRDRLPDNDAAILWRKPMDTYPAIHEFRHHDGLLYGFVGEIGGGDEKSASDSQLQLVCLEAASGELRWSEKGFQNGVSLIVADGLLFVRSYQTLRLVAASPDGYRLLGEVKTHDVWKPTVNLTDLVMPILSRGRLLVRTPNELICYDVAGAGHYNPSFESK